MVCGKGERGNKGEYRDRAAALRYSEMADDLPMLAIAACDALKGGIHKTDPNCLRHGRRVPITRLIHGMNRPDLVERVDARVW